MRNTLLLLLTLTLGACAEINAVPLDEKALVAVQNGAPGFRVPRMTPYLFVARLPAQSVTSTTNAPHQKSASDMTSPSSNSDRTGPRGPVGSPGGENPSDISDAGDSAGKTDDPAAKSSSGSGSDTTFAAQTTTFVMRVVYLPDYQHSVGVSMKGGLFGTSSLSLEFQNGMLTGVNGKVDNTKNADIVTSALQAIATVATGGAAAAAAGPTTASPPGGARRTVVATPVEQPPIKPGLYAFVPIDKSSSPLGLCVVAYFTESGIEAPQEKYPEDPMVCAKKA